VVGTEKFHRDQWVNESMINLPSASGATVKLYRSWLGCPPRTSNRSVAVTVLGPTAVGPSTMLTEDSDW
jgi:hypothetical protein